MGDDSTEYALSLGSNLGDRLENLQTAVQLLDLAAVRKAPVFETSPVDCAPGTQPFFNSVIVARTEGSPEELLASTQSIERQLGRPTLRGINEPRPIDLDILYFGTLVYLDAKLTIPHPRMFQRRFVLEPLARLRPELILPGRDRSVAEELQVLNSEEPPLRLVSEEW